MYKITIITDKDYKDLVELLLNKEYKVQISLYKNLTKPIFTTKHTEDQQVRNEVISKPIKEFFTTKERVTSTHKPHKVHRTAKTLTEVVIEYFKLYIDKQHSQLAIRNYIVENGYAATSCSNILSRLCAMNILEKVKVDKIIYYSLIKEDKE